MAPHDSDSDSASGSDAEEYTETAVLLGYASRDPTDDTFSQLGGQPTWPTTTTTTPTPPPSLALTRCANCSTAPLPLLLQLNGDQATLFPGHTRRLYVFGCRNRGCARKAGSVRCVRASVVDAGLAAAEREKAAERAREDEARRVREEEERRERGGLGSVLFGGPMPTPGEAGKNMNPFGGNPFAAAGSASGGGANPFASPAGGLGAKAAQQPAATLSATFAEKARIADDKDEKKTEKTEAPYEPWPTAAADLPKAYPAYHLDADYETLAPEDPTALPANARLDPDMEEPAEESGGKSGGGKEDKETFESLMDRAFQRFADRLAQNPEQVLRYEWAGQPLLYSAGDRVGKMLGEAEDEEEESSGAKVKMARAGGPQGMPRCGNCGAERVFEVQLTPQAIVELEAEEMSLEGMEWGTIIVGVCAKDCAAKGVKDGEVSYLEEWVGVQWEEVTQRK